MMEGGKGAVRQVPASSNILALTAGTYCLSVARSTEGVETRDLPFLQIQLLDRDGHATGHAVFVNRDGLLRRAGDAALLRVADDATRLLLTSVNLSGRADVQPPEIRIQRLDGEAVAPASVPTTQPSVLPDDPEVLLHIRRRGDVAGTYGEWIGEAAPDSWIEGIQLRAIEGLPRDALEYQATLGKGWLSPWTPAGGFCGSRGMGLPLLGFRARLSAEAAPDWSLTYGGRCVDGTEIAPVAADEVLGTSDLTPLAALLVILEPRRPATTGQLLKRIVRGSETSANRRPRRSPAS